MLPECPQKTNRQLHTKQDMENAIDDISKARNEIEPNDIKDLYHLGKPTSKTLTYQTLAFQCGT